MKFIVSGMAWILALSPFTTCPTSAATESPSPSPSATASAAADQGSAAITMRAKDWLHRLQIGNIDRAQLTDAMNNGFTADTIKAVSDKFGPLGDPQSFTFLGQQPVGSSTAYVYRVVFRSTTLNEVFVVDKDGKISGIHFPPAQ